MDWSFPIGVDLTRSPVVTIEDGFEVRRWPGCVVKIPVEALGNRGPAEARADAAEEPDGAVQELLARLWPVLKDVKTARELGKAIIDARVEAKMKRPLALAARDRLEAKWTTGTVRHWLSPKLHTGTRAEWHREINREATRAWRADPINAERDREATRNWYSDRVNVERARKATRAWRADNPDYHNDYKKARYRNEPAFALAQVARSRVRDALRAARAGKAGKSLDLLGCTPAEFKAHLESRWQPSMSWDNYGNGPGLWVVDHVVPVASWDLTTEEGQRAAFHFSNCQPMWFEENATKSSHHDGRRWTHADHK